MKKDFWWFLMTWTIQGLWVFLTLAMALAAITSELKLPIDIFAVVGVLIWIIGFSIEVIADQQKIDFKDNPRIIFEVYFLLIGYNLYRKTDYPN